MFVRWQGRVVVVLSLLLLGGCAHLRMPKESWGSLWAHGAVSATDELRSKAVAGDAPSQYVLGFSLLYGEGMTRNVAEGLAWLRKSGEGGYVKAQCALGLLFLKGMSDVPKNDAESARWLEKAAQQGNVVAQSSLGALYLSKETSVRDPEAGVVWLKRAAGANDVVAHLALGLMYHKGYVVAQNDEESVRWYRKAAEQGDAIAQRLLGWCYYKGIGLPENESEAIRWLREAADQGDADAKSRLIVINHRK